MKWINEHWKAILTISVAVLVLAIAGELAARLYLGFDFPLEFSLENTTIFSNLVTPIAAIITGYLFVTLSRRQNAMIRSQNIRPHYENKIESLVSKLRTGSSAAGAYSYNVISIRNSIYSFQKEFRNSQQYINDVRDFRKGVLRDNNYHYTRDYYPLMEKVSMSFADGVYDFNEVVGLAREIVNSKMMEDDITILIDQLHTRILKEYVDYIELWDRIGKDENYLVIYEGTNDDLVKMVPLHKTNFRRHYDQLKSLLKW